MCGCIVAPLLHVTSAAAAPAPAPATLSAAPPAQGLVVPTPGSCAPSDQQGQESGVSQFFDGVVGGIPVIGSVSKVVGLVGTVMGTLVEWVSKPGEGAQAVADWGLWNVFGYNPQDPACYSPTSPYGFFSSVVMGDIQLGADSIYSDAYNALATAGIVLVVLAGALRLVRGMADPEVRGEHLILDTTVRIVVGVGAIYVSFPVLAWLLPVTTAVGLGTFGALLSVAGAPAVRDPLGALFFTSLEPLTRLGLMALIALPFAVWFVIKVIGLLIIRFLVVAFGVMFLPLLIAVAVYDPRSKPVRWWGEALASAALIPVVTATLLGGTLGLALRFGAGSPSDGLFSMALIAEIVVTLGGVWLCGRVLRALLFHDIAGGGHPFDPVRRFVGTAVGMGVMLPAAAAGLLAGPAGSAMAGAGGGGGGGGGMTALRSVLGGGRASGSGAGGGGGGMPGSPAEVLASFRGSAEGARVAEAATPDLPPDAGPAGRWSALAADPGMEAPMQRFRGAVLAHVTRTGRMGVAPEEAQRFVHAAWARRQGPRREAA